MQITRITIKGGSGYGPVEEAYADKLTITETSIVYEYKPHPCSNSDTNTFRKWSYKTNSPLFSELYRQLAEMTPRYLYSDEELFVTDIGPTEIIAAFEDKHKEAANFGVPHRGVCDIGLSDRLRQSSKIFSVQEAPFHDILLYCSAGRPAQSVFPFSSHGFSRSAKK